MIWVEGTASTASDAGATLSSAGLPPTSATAMQGDGSSSEDAADAAAWTSDGYSDGDSESSDSDSASERGSEWYDEWY